MVILLWADADDQDEYGNPVTRLKIAKQRNGPTGEVPNIVFHRPQFRFAEVA